jgi:hypothetical protein
MKKLREVKIGKIGQKSASLVKLAKPDFTSLVKSGFRRLIGRRVWALWTIVMMVFCIMPSFIYLIS